MALPYKIGIVCTGEVLRRTVCTHRERLSHDETEIQHSTREETSERLNHDSCTVSGEATDVVHGREMIGDELLRTCHRSIDRPSSSLPPNPETPPFSALSRSETETGAVRAVSCQVPDILPEGGRPRPDSRLAPQKRDTQSSKDTLRSETAVEDCSVQNSAKARWREKNEAPTSAERRPSP